MPRIEVPIAPGFGSIIFSLGFSHRRYRREVGRFQQRLAENWEPFDEVESSLEKIWGSTTAMPFFPTDLHFAVLPRSQSKDSHHRFWDFLEVPPIGNDQLLVLVPNPLDSTGEFNLEERTRLHLISSNQHVILMMGAKPVWRQDWSLSDYYQYHTSAGIVKRGTWEEASWERLDSAGFNSGDSPEEIAERNTAIQDLLSFIINDLPESPASDDQINQLKELRPEVNYHLLQKESVVLRKSPFELTPQEFFSWLSPVDAQNVRELKVALDNFAQEKKFDIGLVATGSMTDPTRRWSSSQTKEVDFWFCLAGDDRLYDHDKLAEFLKEKLNWECHYIEGDVDYGGSPHFYLQPATGTDIELHPELQVWQRQEDIAGIISPIRSPSRSRNFRVHSPYFSVLIEPTQEPDSIRQL